MLCSPGASMSLQMTPVCPCLEQSGLPLYIHFLYPFICWGPYRLLSKCSCYELFHRDFWVCYPLGSVLSTQDPAVISNRQKCVTVQRHRQYEDGSRGTGSPHSSLRQEPSQQVMIPLRAPGLTPWPWGAEVTDVKIAHLLRLAEDTSTAHQEVHHLRRQRWRLLWWKTHI